MPAAMPATCVPCPPEMTSPPGVVQSSGSGSGWGAVCPPSGLYASPTKSQPPTTFAVGKLPGSIRSGSLARYASLVPMPAKSACV